MFDVGQDTSAGGKKIEKGKNKKIKNMINNKEQ
jgi:hypothetical protein